MKTLNTPPLLIGAGLLLWGWQSGFLLVGALMGTIIEGSRVVGLRWELSEKDFRRIYDFSLLLLVTAAVYLFTSTEGPGMVSGFLSRAGPAAQSRAMSETAQAMLVLFRWTPMIFFLFVAAQAYSTTEFIPWSVFSLPPRRRRARPDPKAPPLDAGLNVANRYLAVCLLAACVPIRPNGWFYPALAFLVSWALWNRRSPRYGLATWATLALVALAAGYFAQLAFFQLANWANAYSTNLLAGLVNRSTDPRENRTALGQIGQLKFSGQVVMRVESRDERPVPPLLREASYRFFRFPDWAGAGRIRDFGNVATDSNSTTWVLAPTHVPEHAITIAQHLPDRGTEARRGLLAVPQGIVRLEKLPVFVMSTNCLGVVRVEEGPGLVVYDAYYSKRTTLDSAPTKEDLAIPSGEEIGLTQVAGELELDGKATNDILQAVAGFFTDHFRYSTWLAPDNFRRTNLTAVARFLLHDRAGHCEYFATATVLLLRKAGVPARYAVGYAVHEKSGRKYVVRQRHAHAWCLAWIDGAWQDFDTTPATWFAAEDSRASWTEWFADLWWRVSFEFSRWRWGQAHLRDYLLWLLPPVLAVLLIRLVLGNHWKRLRQKKADPKKAAPRPGDDSEFYLLEQEFARHGLPRPDDETPLGWLARRRSHALVATLDSSLRPVLDLHYRYRFDPAGLSRTEREQLRTGAEGCVAKLRETLKP